MLIFGDRLGLANMDLLLALEALIHAVEHADVDTATIDTPRGRVPVMDAAKAIRDWCYIDMGKLDPGSMNEEQMERVRAQARAAFLH